MMYASIYDNDKVYIDTIKVEEVEENMTTVIYTGGLYNPIFDELNQTWIEGWTQEEIEEFKRIEEANRPPTEPDKNTILEGQISDLEIEILKMKRGVV